MYLIIQGIRKQIKDPKFLYRDDGLNFKKKFKDETTCTWSQKPNYSGVE